MRKRKNTLLSLTLRRLQAALEPLLALAWVLSMTGLAVFVLWIWIQAT